MLINVVLIKKNMYIKQFVALSRFHATAVDCELELINEESGIKRESVKISKINKRGVLNNVGEGDKKRNN